jgi:anti-sigma regulatory factor (Ser/Thr protein kinase)
MARMRLFEHLGATFDERPVTEHEEAGRFLPVTQVTRRDQVPGVIGSISALLHLQDDPESLAAVQYCISELLRNVLEHSGSADGAFVAAHRYTKKGPHRVTIAVADCGRGIADHLGQVHAEALKDDEIALRLAMRPGITGARAGIYGVPDNAGAGLFITRCIAKGTGGYFLLTSGRAVYRLRRGRNDDEMLDLHVDGYDDPRHDEWRVPAPWQAR